MKAYLLNLFDRLRASYWFLPTLMCALIIILSKVLAEVDVIVHNSELKLPTWLNTEPAAARSILSTIAGSLIAVIGTVFSITIVMLSLASQQFGPRLLRRFMIDLPTQIALSVIVSTELYTLIVLSSLEASSGKSSTPVISIFSAILMTLFCIVALIYFIHHTAVQIQAPNVIRAVAEELDATLNSMYPTYISNSHLKVNNTLRVTSQDYKYQINSRSKGYLQAIDTEGMLKFAEENDISFYLLKKTGSFIIENEPIVLYKGNPTVSQSELEEKINSFFIIGAQRSPRQDLVSPIKDLVEISLRALSPGINDPYSAITCINYLANSVSKFANRVIEPGLIFDKKSNLRLVLKKDEFENIVDEAFTSIRNYSANSLIVKLKLLENYKKIGEQCVSNFQIEVIMSQVKKIEDDASISKMVNADFLRVKQFSQEIIDTLLRKESQNNAANKQLKLNRVLIINK
ncbi:MAG: DUF2254 domain-containing protein [Bdellovibrionales bacterium]|nr:DUF2254 domain-containing protein [Bdellovibrionales bacterium]